MLNDSQLNKAIADSITLATGQPFSIRNSVGTSGGCINSCFIVDDDNRHYFIKTNTPDAISMFEAESQALNEIADTQTLRVPSPVCIGHNSKQSWLVMENLLMHSNGRQHQLGEQLAAMHQVTSPQYGWSRDNTIGSTPQINTQSNDWIEFFRDQRLGFQLALAASNGYHGKLQKSGETLLGCMTDFFRRLQLSTITFTW
jgi:protein-ribulosamine 3-kinase